MECHLYCNIEIICYNYKIFNIKLEFPAYSDAEIGYQFFMSFGIFHLKSLNENY